MSAADVMLARLKRLPPRLRIAHLAALLRWERQANAHEYACSYPSPRKSSATAFDVDVSSPPPKRAREKKVPAAVKCDSPPRKGEGSATSGSRRDGRAG
jgi:hypothetical protein